MKFVETPLKGAFVLELELCEDERGFFARSWCESEFKSHGLDFNIAQCSISFNKKKGTLRGMHYQVKPHEEAKLVRCTMGAVYDVIIDIRSGSPTARKWFAVELNADNRRMLYAPKGFAHGYITLKNKSEIFYQISEVYHSERARGARWNDPVFGIKWPLQPRVIAVRDAGYKDFEL